MSNVILDIRSNVKIGFLTSKYDIWPHFNCQNRILNVKNALGLCSNVKIGFRISKYDIRPHFEC